MVIAREAIDRLLPDVIDMQGLRPSGLPTGPDIRVSAVGATNIYVGIVEAG